MKIEIRSSFVRDAKKLPLNIQKKLAQAIQDIEKVDSLNALRNIKQMKGSSKPAYRLRIEDYRLCFYYLENTAELIRILPRKTVYRYFP